MSLTYTSFLSALTAAVLGEKSDPTFLGLIPAIIDDAEQKIYRELDLVSSNVTVSGTATANSRTLAIPQGSGHIIVLDAINVLDGSSVRYPVTPATRETIDFLFPTEAAPSTPSIPKYFARIDDTNVLWGPAPDSGYTTEVVGTIRPTPLSSSNTTTFLTSYLSDLFFAAAMVSADGYMRNLGRPRTDPSMALSWEQQYQQRFASARKEELRKSYVSQISPPPQSAKDA